MKKCIMFLSLCISLFISNSIVAQGTLGDMVRPIDNSSNYSIEMRSWVKSSLDMAKEIKFSKPYEFFKRKGTRDFEYKTEYANMYVYYIEVLVEKKHLKKKPNSSEYTNFPKINFLETSSNQPRHFFPKLESEGEEDKSTILMKMYLFEPGFSKMKITVSTYGDVEPVILIYTRDKF